MTTSTAAPPKNPALAATQVNAMDLLGCSSRKVNSSAKETYVTNLLVLDPQNSGGASTPSRSGTTSQIR